MESLLTQFGLSQKTRGGEDLQKILLLKFDIVETLTKEVKFRTLISKPALYLNADAGL